jgi:hypothetical protein
MKNISAPFGTKTRSEPPGNIHGDSEVPAALAAVGAQGGAWRPSRRPGVVGLWGAKVHAYHRRIGCCAGSARRRTGPAAAGA